MSRKRSISTQLIMYNNNEVNVFALASLAVFLFIQKAFDSLPSDLEIMLI